MGIIQRLNPTMDPSLSDLLLPGLKLMLIGMGIVFLFLALLVWIIGITSRLVTRYNPQPERPVRAGVVIDADEAELVAVIGAALRQQIGR
ncbi:MAG: OadG family protein [Methylococcaceae bacterium]